MEYIEYRIIVAGSRTFQDYEHLRSVLDEYIRNIPGNPLITMVSGTASGADLLGERYAMEHSYLLELFPADWKNGGLAGRIRNARMADFASLKKGVLFAFWDGKSYGTKHMIECAEKYKLETHVIKV